jgi:hypothetical protein
MGTKHAFHANGNITSLAVNLAFLFEVGVALREYYFSILEMNDVVWLVLKFVHMFTDACHAQINLTGVAELLGGVITEVTRDDLLRPGNRRGHCLLFKT